MLRRNGDEYVRQLERKVLEGDLTLVPQLARVYERIGRGLPAVDPIVTQALGAAGELRGTPGSVVFRAGAIARIALRVLNGEQFDVEGETTEIMQDPEAGAEFFDVGIRVHIDTDNPEWGRLACDAVIDEVRPRTLRVTTLDHQRTTITIPRRDARRLGLMCNCGHRRNLHTGRGSRCHGIGADLAPEYGIPADEVCACARFDPAD